MTKPKCLTAFKTGRPARAYALARASGFLKKFPWFSFALQAPQALYSLTGYGLVLGTAMGAITDLTWALIQAPWKGLPTFNGPPPADPLGKAVNYLSQPAYHMTKGQLFSPEDHWLLLAADVVATGIVMANYHPSAFEARLDQFHETKIATRAPWYPPTIEALTSEGWNPSIEASSPIIELPEFPTYGQVSQLTADNFPAWLEELRLDFPDDENTAYFANVLFENGREVLAWANDGKDETTPIYTPEEYTIARCFEYRVFPPLNTEETLVEIFIAHALARARAAGRDLPGPSDLETAAIRTFGSFSRT